MVSFEFSSLPDQDGKEEAQVQIEALEKDKKKLERKLAALSAKSSALKEANESQAVTLDGLQVTAHIPSTIPLELEFLNRAHYLRHWSHFPTVTKLMCILRWSAAKFHSLV